MKEALSVAGWELRRVLATRSTLLLAAGTTAFFLALTAFKHQWLEPLNDRSHVLLALYGSTSLGEVYQVVAVVMTFFGLLVPFLATDGVAREHSQRTHELVMTTAVRSDALVAGRFVAVLAQTMAAALLTLAGTLAAQLLAHAAQPAFPAPDLRSLLTLWALLVLPAGTLLAGVSFMAGTLVPRQGIVVRIAVVLVWIAMAAVVDLASSFAWYPYWSPAGNSLLGVARTTFVQAYVGLAGTTATVDPALVARAQQTVLDLRPWMLPHAGLACAGLACAIVAAAGFRRFRGLI